MQLKEEKMMLEIENLKLDKKIKEQDLKLKEMQVQQVVKDREKPVFLEMIEESFD